MKRGTGILDLASVFISRRLYGDAADRDVEMKKLRDEQILGRVQEGGNIDKDLRCVWQNTEIIRVLYWHEAQDLESLLLAELVSDMETMTGAKLTNRPNAGMG